MIWTADSNNASACCEYCCQRKAGKPTVQCRWLFALSGRWKRGAPVIWGIWQPVAKFLANLFQVVWPKHNPKLNLPVTINSEPTFINCKQGQQIKHSKGWPSCKVIDMTSNATSRSYNQDLGIKVLQSTWRWWIGGRIHDTASSWKQARNKIMQFLSVWWKVSLIVAQWRFGTHNLYWVMGHSNSAVLIHGSPFP